MTSTETTTGLSGHMRKRSLFSRMARGAIDARLTSLPAGALKVTLPDGAVVYRRGVLPGPSADFRVRRWRGFWRMLSEGDIGLARAYMDADIDTSDIKALIDYGAANVDALSGVVPGSRLTHIFGRLRHWRRGNTRRGSRRNIAAHYDLGNDFYAQWLDPGMQYSSALYTSPGQSLEQAQDKKLRRIAELLDVSPGQHVLEIGCGWGALAEHLVARHGCAVTGLTLSVEQQAYSQARLGSENHTNAANFRLQDYRDLSSRYDRIASVEMLEAVGERFWPLYFQKLRRSLTDTGVAVRQVITIAEDRFADYRRTPDFIQRYIFPGGMLPTVEIVKQQASRAGLVVTAHEEFGESYTRTLIEWRRRFLQAWPDIEPLGFDARFKRMWDYYLAYCQAGFEAGLINVGLFKLACG